MAQLAELEQIRLNDRHAAGGSRAALGRSPGIRSTRCRRGSGPRGADVRLSLWTSWSTYAGFFRCFRARCRAACPTGNPSGSLRRIRCEVCRLGSECWARLGIGRKQMRVTANGGTGQCAALLDVGLHSRSDRGVLCRLRDLRRVDPGSGGIALNPDSNPRPAPCAGVGRFGERQRPTIQYATYRMTGRLAARLLAA
jgi:hypothetical protein